MAVICQRHESAKKCSEENTNSVRVYVCEKERESIK